MSDASESFFITPKTDLVLLEDRYGLEALRGAMDDPKLPAEIQSIVAFYVLSTSSGTELKRAVVSEYPAGWKQRRQ